MKNRKTISKVELVESLNEMAVIKLNERGKVIREPALEDFEKALGQYGVGICDKCRRWSVGLTDVECGCYFKRLCADCIGK